MWQAIIQAAQKKKDGIANSFGDMARTQGQFAMNGSVGLNPSNQQINTPQNFNNNGFSLTNTIGNMFNKKPNLDTNNGYSAIGNEIQTQTQNPNLFDYITK